MTPAGTDDLAVSPGELAALLLATRTVTEALQQVADDAVRHVPAATGCGLTLLINDQLGTAATTGTTPARLDQEQYDRGQGPCLDAAYSGRPTLVADFATEQRWADYPAVATGCGMRSLYSEPVWAPQALGALNLYSPLPGGFGAGEQATARMYADHAAIVLTVVAGWSSEAALTAQLRDALAARGVIDQAVGVLMARRHCRPAEGHRLLEAAAQREAVPLRRLAAGIVAGTAPAGAPADLGVDRGKPVESFSPDWGRVRPRKG
jgi:hypothetical protein